MVENCAAGVVLMRCLLVLVEETSELAGVLSVEDAAEVWTEVEAEGFVELVDTLVTAEVAGVLSVLSVEDMAEVWTEL